jgi:hypothetical protein
VSEQTVVAGRDAQARDEVVEQGPDYTKNNTRP